MIMEMSEGNRQCPSSRPSAYFATKTIDPLRLYFENYYHSHLLFILSLGLIYFSFGIENLKWMGLFLFFSLGAIWAAYNYTIGEKAYGYYALGDVFALVFLGL